jgi:ACS family hexuronate transporter-like MFS transporter
VMQTLPPHLRARGVAIAYSGGSLGAIVAPLVVTPIHAVWGWRAAFLFTGVVGFAWVALWLLVVHRIDIGESCERLAPSAEPQGRVPGDSGAPRQSTSARPGPGLADPRMWAFMFAYALGGAPLAFILYYSAGFLKQTFSLTQVALGQLLWIPPAGWEFGYFFWGWLSDRAHRTGQHPRVVERRLMLLLAVLSLPLAALAHCPSLAGAMAMMFFAMAIAAGFIIVAISYATHVYSTASSGLIAGLGAGAWSAGVALASPVYGYLFDIGQVALAFLLASLLPAAGLLLWLGLSAWGQTRE